MGTKYEVKELRKHCYELFGITNSTFDGAFFLQNPNKLYSKEEAEEIINKWLKE